MLPLRQVPAAIKRGRDEPLRRSLLSSPYGYSSPCLALGLVAVAARASSVLAAAGAPPFDEGQDHWPLRSGCVGVRRLSRLRSTAHAQSHHGGVGFISLVPMWVVNLGNCVEGACGEYVLVEDFAGGRFLCVLKAVPSRTWRRYLPYFVLRTFHCSALVAPAPYHR